MTIKKQSRKIEAGLKKAATTIGKTMARSQAKLEKTGRKAAKGAGKLVEEISHSAGKELKTTMKKGKKLEAGLKKAATSIGKTMARSQAKLEKTGRKAAKDAGKLVKGIGHTAEEVLAKTANKLKQAEERISGEMEKGSSRFRCAGKKSVAEAIGKLSEEVRVYLEEHEEIGASKLLSAMKSRDHSDAMVYAAMGWLLRDKKINISSDGKKVSLA